MPSPSLRLPPPVCDARSRSRLGPAIDIDIDALRLASGTLTRATAFLAAGLEADSMFAAAPPAGRARARVLGNALRELDRFLNLLTDAAAEAVGGAGVERARFQRLRNTPNKLRMVRTAMALPSPDHDRLRALGRSRDRLFHRDGARAAADHGACDPPPWSTVDLAETCLFYDRIAADLMQSIGRYRRLR